MNNNSNGMSTGAAILMTLGIMLVIGMIMSAGEPKCSLSGCKNDAKEGGRYCYLHDMSYRWYGNADYNEVYRNSQNRRNNTSTSRSSQSNTTSSSSTRSSSTTTKATTKSYSSYDSYDEGYEDVYENDDYDWDRYYSDDDYASGVDDAMDELDW